MPRVSGASAKRQRLNKVRKSAKGFWGSRKNLNRITQESVDRARQFAYRDRRQRKRQMRRLWIVRINAAARLNEISYSRLMAGLKTAGVEIDRKVLADLAISDPDGFGRLAETAKQALGS
ncbi:MAG: 50S ribosomal protein L20 [Deltaproteobacteria bacterium]|nr:50S ribosomal protein L20 [Deltaproteobacteria bacterium]